MIKKAAATEAEKKIIREYCESIKGNYDFVKADHGVGLIKGRDKDDLSLAADNRQFDAIAGDYVEDECIAKEGIEVEMSLETFDCEQVRELYDYCRSNDIQFTLIVPEDAYDQKMKDTIYSCLCTGRRGHGVLINLLTYPGFNKDNLFMLPCT